MAEELYGFQAADSFDSFAATEQDPMGYAYFPKSFFLKKELPKKKKEFDALAGCAPTPLRPHACTHMPTLSFLCRRFIGQVSKVNKENFSSPTVMVSFADGQLEYPVEQTFKGKKAHIYLKNPEVYFITAEHELINGEVSWRVPLAPSPPPSMPPTPPSAIEQASVPRRAPRRVPRHAPARSMPRSPPSSLSHAPCPCLRRLMHTSSRTWISAHMRALTFMRSPAHVPF